LLDHFFFVTINVPAGGEEASEGLLAAEQEIVAVVSDGARYLTGIV